MKALISAHLDLVKKVSDEDLDQGKNLICLVTDTRSTIKEIGFGTAPTPLASRGAAGMRRAGTIIRSPIESRQRDRDKQQEGELRASEVMLPCIPHPALLNSILI
jgi:hypothetical protein